MKVNQLKLGVFLSYVQMALGILIGLVYTPVMIRLLGQNEYGLYNMVSSTISMLSVLNLGFNSSYIRYYSKYKKNDDKEAIYKLNGLMMLVFSVISMIALLCGLYLTFHLELVFDTGLTTAEYEIARVLMLLLTINLSISFLVSVFSSIISAHERYVFLKLLDMFRSVFGPFVTLPLLLLGFRSIAMVAVTLVISLVCDAILVGYVLGCLRQRFVFHHFEKGLLGSLFAYTFFLAINLIVNQINWNVAKILLGRYRGTEAVAVYSVGFSLYQYYSMFSSTISAVFTPRIHRIVNTVEAKDEQQKQLTSLFTRVGRIQFLILGLLASGIVFFGYPFITNIWAGAEYGESYYVVLLLTLPASIALIQNLGIEIQRAQNKHQFRSVVYLGMALLNVVVSVFLCQKYGAVGATIGTAVSLVIANGLIMNIYYHKQCNINILKFWGSIGHLSLGLIPSILVGIFLCRTFEFSSIGSLALGILVYTLVYVASMWLLGMNREEKNLVLAPVKKIIKRIHGDHVNR